MPISGLLTFYAWISAALLGWQSQEPGLVFRSETRAIEIQIAVKDTAGGTVRDLRIEDFTVFDNGKRRGRRFHKLKVEVDQPGAVLHYRRGYSPLAMWETLP
jgi:hypothetical protein